MVRDDKSKLNNTEKCPEIVHGHIHWYPGHIAKAERALKEKINLVDVVIEILDARIPLSSCYGNIKALIGEKPRLVLLNKSDLVNEAELKEWIKILEERSGCPVLISDAKNSKNLNKIIAKAVELSEPRMQSLMAKGLLRRAARAVVVGMPNVGKSSIINKLTRTSKTKVGAKAGVTRQQQWVKVNPKLDLLDTPGIIPMKQDDQIRAKKLTFVNSVSENAYDSQSAAQELLAILALRYEQVVREYYKLSDNAQLSVENIARARNWITRDNQCDIERTSIFILRDFREGRMGHFILDEFE